MDSAVHVEGDVRPSAVAAIARTVLDPHDPRLAVLMRVRSWCIYRDIARCYLLIAVAWAALAISDAWWLVALPAFLLIGTQQYALSVIAHEGRHGRLLRRRRANDWVTRGLLGAPLLHDAYYEAESTLHFEHHRRLGTKLDPESRLYSFDDKATRSAFLLYLSGLPAVPRVLGKIARQSSTVAAGTGAVRRLLLAWAPIAGAQLAILLAAMLLESAWYYLFFWLAPLYVCVFVPKKVRVLCEHGQPVPDGAAGVQRLITFVPGRIERWLLAPMNMQYHAEHHLWPAVPYYNLPALHDLVAGTSAVEIRPSYVGYLFSYFQRLPAPAR